MTSLLVLPFCPLGWQKGLLGFPLVFAADASTVWCRCASLTCWEGSGLSCIGWIQIIQGPYTLGYQNHAFRDLPFAFVSERSEKMPKKGHDMKMKCCDPECVFREMVVQSSFCGDSKHGVLLRLRKASNKLKTGSLSQSMSKAATSKARIILRVSFPDHYLGDVAILKLGKSSRVQSSSQVDLEKCRIAHQKAATATFHQNSFESILTLPTVRDSSIRIKTTLTQKCLLLHAQRMHQACLPNLVDSS